MLMLPQAKPEQVFPEIVQKTTGTPVELAAENCSFEPATIVTELGFNVRGLPAAAKVPVKRASAITILESNFVMRLATAILNASDIIGGNRR